MVLLSTKSKLWPYIGEGGGGRVHESKVISFPEYLEPLLVVLFSSKLAVTTGVQSSAESPPKTTNPVFVELPMLSNGKQNNRQRNRAGLAIVIVKEEIR